MMNKMLCRQLSWFWRFSKTIILLMVTLFAMILLTEQRYYNLLFTIFAHVGPRIEDNSDSWLSKVDDGIGSGNKPSDYYPGMLEDQPKPFNEDVESFICNNETSDIYLAKRYKHNEKLESVQISIIVLY